VFIDTVQSAYIKRSASEQLDVPDPVALHWELHRHVIYNFDWGCPILSASLLRGILYLKDPEFATQFLHYQWGELWAAWGALDQYPRLYVIWKDWRNRRWQSEFFPVYFCSVPTDNATRPSYSRGGGRVAMMASEPNALPDLNALNWHTAQQYGEPQPYDQYTFSSFSTHMIHTELPS
jgi:hypothetical protein